jgi:hypothetical protein
MALGSGRPPAFDGRLRPSTRAWAFFVAWAVIGAAYCLSILGALSIGVFVLPVALIATGFIATRRGGATGLLGIVAGLGLPLLYVALLNRRGPGTVCTAVHGGQSCSDEWSPWPFLVAGLVPLVASTVYFGVQQRRYRLSGSRAAG